MVLFTLSVLHLAVSHMPQGLRMEPSGFGKLILLPITHQVRLSRTVMRSSCVHDLACESGRIACVKSKPLFAVRLLVAFALF